MGNGFLKAGIRTLFFFTRRGDAVRKTRRLRNGYLKLARGIDPLSGSQSIEVPAMPGVDEDMRRWSFYMILQHNDIVNRMITATVEQLVQNGGSRGGALIDFKKDVMPSPSAGEEQVPRLRESVDQHLETIARLAQLRGTRTSRHPLFGDFDAHQWNCMFAFHLAIHYRQARHVVRTLTSAV